jgi:hypothetical protein
VNLCLDILNLGLHVVDLGLHVVLGEIISPSKGVLIRALVTPIKIKLCIEILMSCTNRDY